MPRRSPGRLRLDWTSEGCRRLWQGTCAWLTPAPGSPPAGPSGGLTHDPVLIPRLPLSAQTLVLRGQSHSAASFLKCTQTQQAETCPATFCWTRTMTRRAPPCEEASAQPCPVHPQRAAGTGGRPRALQPSVAGRGGPAAVTPPLAAPRDGEADAQGRMTRVVEKLAFFTWGSNHTKKKKAHAESGQAATTEAGRARELPPPGPRVAPAVAERRLPVYLTSLTRCARRPPRGPCPHAREAPAPSQVAAGSVASASWP